MTTGLKYTIMLVFSCLTIVGLSVGTYVADIKEIDTKLYEAWVYEYTSPNGDQSPVLYEIEQSVSFSSLFIAFRGGGAHQMSFPQYKCCGFFNASHMEVPPNICLSHIRDAADGCYDLLYSEMLRSLQILFAIGLAGGVIQAFGIIFSMLAFKEAPSQQELDSLLSEEARRLNDSWTVSTSVQKD